MIYQINGASYDSDYLAHYGILGMRWGVRRYQNEDGTLTDAGRKRYSFGKIFESRKHPGYSILQDIMGYDERDRAQSASRTVDATREIAHISYNRYVSASQRYNNSIDFKLFEKAFGSNAVTYVRDPYYIGGDHGARTVLNRDQIDFDNGVDKFSNLTPEEIRQLREMYDMEPSLRRALDDATSAHTADLTALGRAECTQIMEERSYLRTPLSAISSAANIINNGISFIKNLFKKN